MLTIDEIMERYAGQGDEEFTVTLSDGGGEIRAKTTRDASRLMAIEERVEAFQSLLKGGGTPPAWEPFLPVAPKIARMCVYVEEFSVEPKFETLDCLRLAKNGGITFIEIAGEIIGKVGGAVAQAEAAQLEEEKNAFGETAGTEQGSPSPATCTEEITAA